MKPHINAPINSTFQSNWSSIMEEGSFLGKVHVFYTYWHVGVQKNNDLARRHYMLSNHQDAPKDVIETEGRREVFTN